MADYGKIAKELIKRNLGEARFEEICQRFGLSSHDKELPNELMSRWKPDYSLDDIVALCEEFKNRPNIGQVMQAWEVIAREAAQISYFHRQGKERDDVRDNRHFCPLVELRQKLLPQLPCQYWRAVRAVQRGDRGAEL